MTTGGWTETGATWDKDERQPPGPAATFSTSDYNGTALGTIDPSSTGLKTLSNAALKTLVEAWVAGTKINKGLVLITTGTGGNSRQ